MSVHKTSDGTWRVKYRENGRQFSKNFPTKALASRFDADVKERKVEGRPLARLKASFLGLLPNPLLTVDQVKLLETDNVVSAEAVKDGRTIEGLDDDDRIASIALRHHLVSRTTSLVATEKVPSSCGPSGDAPVEVPSMLPAGMEVGGLIGATGQGIGGGGTAMGIGGLGTRGMGSGAAGYGTGGGTFGAQGEGGIGTPVGKDAIILGALDKSLIDQVIRRHMNQIRYCYQRELTKEPTLAGKVMVKFVIAASGDVAAAEIQSSTLGNTAVEECIRGRVLRMTFPQPGGGGVVVVNYPFVFSPN